MFHMNAPERLALIRQLWKARVRVGFSVGSLGLIQPSRVETEEVIAPIYSERATDDNTQDEIKENISGIKSALSFDSTITHEHERDSYLNAHERKQLAREMLLQRLNRK